MKKTFSLGICAALLLAATSRSQVVISEINFDAGNGGTQWIELLNMGSNKVGLSQWAIYQATKTPNMANNYWFGFPSGTEILPGAYLRVHWLSAVIPSTKKDIWTGNTVYHFLFALKAEPLSQVSGALALFNTQQNIMMNDPAAIQDWVSWGVPGQKRENIAVAGGRWRSGQAAPSPLASDTLSLDYTAAAEPTPASAFFRDITPTPLAHNHPNARTSTHGSSCAVGNIVAPSLIAASIPALGNRDYGFRIAPTASGQIVALALGLSKAGTPIKLGGCSILIELKLPVIVLSTAANNGSTTLPANLMSPTLNGGSAEIQALVIRSPNFALSNGLSMTLGTK